MLITIIICTYRRIDRLELALSSLVRQTYKGADWEVLVVENDRVSSTAMLTTIDRHKGRLPLRHILEPCIGLSNARNTGARLASGEYLAYMDDDAKAEYDWLAELIDLCRSSKPDFCGGPSFPLYLSPKPIWYLDTYATSYVYGVEEKLLKRGEWLGGMNFIVAKKLCDLLGGFSIELGMTGKKIAYGEETDLMIRAWAENPQLKVIYHPKVIVYHEVRPEKMTIRWKIKAAIAGGQSATIMSPISRKKAAVELMRNIKSMLIHLLHAVQRFLNNHEKPFIWQQWSYEILCPWLWNFSRNIHSLFWK